MQVTTLETAYLPVCRTGSMRIMWMRGRYRYPLRTWKADDGTVVVGGVSERELTESKFLYNV